MWRFLAVHRIRPAFLTVAQFASSSGQQCKPKGEDQFTITSSKHRLIAKLRSAVTRRPNEIVIAEGRQIVSTLLSYDWRPDFILGTLAEIKNVSMQFPHTNPAASNEAKGKASLVTHTAPQHLVESCMSQRRLEPIIAMGPFTPMSIPRNKVPSRAVAVCAQDPHNVGSIIRSAVAFGFENIFLLEGCADPLGTAALRASAGAAFLARFGTAQLLNQLLSKFDMVLRAEAHGEDQEDCLSNVNVNGNILVILGHEGRGIPEQYRKVGRPLCLKINRKVDSLGVSAAAAIIFAQLAQRPNSGPC